MIFLEDIKKKFKFATDLVCRGVLYPLTVAIFYTLFI